VPLAEHLSESSVLLAPNVADKWNLMDQMVDHLVSSNTLSKELEGPAKAALNERERSVSTGMEQGIAVPHASLEELDCLKVAMALIPSGLEFESVDGKPAEIVICLLVPKAEKLLHLSTLTEIARRLGQASFRAKLLACRNPQDAVACWA
jgi:mannitol/fructose-specific phosphotransferase system IIA component (Ntr-type)